MHVQCTATVDHFASSISPDQGLFCTEIITDLNCATNADLAATTAPPATPGRPGPVEDLEWAAAVAKVVAAAEHYTQVNAEQRGKSWALAPTIENPNEVRAWTNRHRWQQQLRSALNSTWGRRICTNRQVNTEAVFATGVMMASCANSATGRDVTKARETLATETGLKIWQVDRARGVLKDLQLGVEMARGRYLTSEERAAARHHHGKTQIRAASTWALTSPQVIVKSYAQIFSSADLIPLGGVLSLPPVGNNSPKRERKRSRTARSRRNTHRPAGRPDSATGKSSFDQRGVALPAQRTAGELITHIPALSRHFRPVFGKRAEHRTWSPQRQWRHIGELCRVVDKLGLGGVPGKDLAKALTADTVARGWIWPNEIERPVGFLTWRLQQLDLAALRGTLEASGAQK